MTDLYRKLSECPGCGSTEADCLSWWEARDYSGKCCPDCKHDQRVEAEKMWWCERDDLGDPNCFKRNPSPKPEQAWHPTKHSACRWVLIVEVNE